SFRPRRLLSAPWLRPCSRREARVRVHPSTSSCRLRAVAADTTRLPRRGADDTATRYRACGGTEMSAMQVHHSRPWHGSYGERPFTIEPASTTALEMFRCTVDRDRSAALVHYFDRSLTAGQLDSLSDALAVGLQRYGVRHGERVAIYLQNVPQVVI